MKTGEKKTRPSAAWGIHENRSQTRAQSRPDGGLFVGRVSERRRGTPQTRLSNRQSHLAHRVRPHRRRVGHSARVALARFARAHRPGYFHAVRVLGRDGRLCGQLRFSACGRSGPRSRPRTGSAHRHQRDFGDCGRRAPARRPRLVDHPWRGALFCPRADRRGIPRSRASRAVGLADHFFGVGLFGPAFRPRRTGVGRLSPLGGASFSCAGRQSDPRIAFRFTGLARHSHGGRLCGDFGLLAHSQRPVLARHVRALLRL